jgi:rubrerythrin
MDLSKYSLTDLFLTGIRSEMDSKTVYEGLANRVQNAFMKDRLMFLAKEEDRHRAFIEQIYKDNFPGQEIVVPTTTPVPLPEVALDNEMMPISEVLEMAMKAELAAREFYTALAERFPETSNSRRILLYFGKMELGHYEILKTEQENAKVFEEFDQTWNMMHVGP